NDDNLEVGEIWRYRATHVITQAEIDSNGGGDGKIDNTATADSTESAPDSASASVPLVRTPALNITQVVNDVDGDTTAPSVDAARDVATYSITVANTGHTTLSGVTVTDTLDPSVPIRRASDLNDDNLEVGETWRYRARHVITQADIDTNGGGDG